MRPVARNLVVALLLVVAFLLALGAVPGLLRAGDPYYVTANATEDDRPAVSADALSTRRYPYATGALAADGPGRSDPYWRGPLGVKGTFTHSPFDEFDALRQQYPNATDGTAVYLRQNGTTYELTIVQERST